MPSLQCKYIFDMIIYDWLYNMYGFYENIDIFR